MQTTNNIELRAMVNALHVQFHNAIVQSIQNYGIAALGLDEKTAEAYKEAVGKEQDYVNRPLKSLYTERLATLDRQRDGLVGDVLGRLEHAWASPVDAVRDAYETIKIQILDRYPRSIKSEAAQRESGLIGGLVMDLEKIDEEVLKALGVDALAAELKKVNERFTKVYLARNAERTQVGTGVTLTLRAACDGLYRLLCLQVNYLASRTDDVIGTIADASAREKAMAQRILILRFVAELNEHIAYFKTQYLKRGKGATKASDDEEVPGNDASASTGGGSDTDSSAKGGSNDTDSSGKPTGPTDVTEVFD